MRPSPFGRPFRSARASLAALAAAALLACFEFSPPVAEKMEIKVLADGRAEIAVTVSLADPAKRFQRNQKVRARLEETQASLLAQRDDWSRLFGRTAWTKESLAWEKESGHLSGWSRRGLLSDAKSLEGFLGGLGLPATVEGLGEFSELRITPGPSARATSTERAEFEAYLDGWTPALGAYLSAAKDLWTYLEGHPERTRDCVGQMYSDWLAEEVAAALQEPTPEEASLLDKLGEAMGEVVAVLQTPPESDRPPEEISRLVCDPFPSEVTLEMPGEILEVEGFEKMGGTRVRHSGVSLWQAFRKLEGRWISPDPLLPLIPYLLEERDKEGSPFDLDSFLAAPRRSNFVPSREELRRAIEESLEPASEYRVRWRPPTP